MMGSSSVTFVGISDAPTLEALRAAKQWHWQMIDLHLTRILASSDCQTVIKDLETIGGGGGGVAMWLLSRRSKPELVSLKPAISYMKVQGGTSRLII